MERLLVCQRCGSLGLTPCRCTRRGALSLYRSNSDICEVRPFKPLATIVSIILSHIEVVWAATTSLQTLERDLTRSVPLFMRVHLHLVLDMFKHFLSVVSRNKVMIFLRNICLFYSSMRDFSPVVHFLSLNLVAPCVEKLTPYYSGNISSNHWFCCVIKSLILLCNLHRRLQHEAMLQDKAMRRTTPSSSSLAKDLIFSYLRSPLTILSTSCLLEEIMHNQLQLPWIM